MQSKTSLSEKPNKIRILLFHPDGDPSGSVPEPWTVVSSPIRCLGMALENRPDLIAIVIPAAPGRERRTRMELCAELKRIQATKSLPLLALLAAPHRVVMENLARAGVDFIRFIGIHGTGNGLRADVLRQPGPEEGAEARLLRVCPHLHYIPIDTEREMAVCGAYRDRLVLGARTLKELCHEPAHEHCQYFQDPVEAR